MLPSRDWITAHPEDYERLTPPPALSAGSVTVHDGYMLHGSDPNTWDQPRVAYSLAFFPADALYNGMPARQTDGLGLQIDQPINHDLFPIIA